MRSKNNIQKTVEQIMQLKVSMDKKELLSRYIQIKFPEITLERRESMVDWMVTKIPIEDIFRAMRRYRQKIGYRDMTKQRLAQEERRFCREEKMLPTQPPTLFN